MTTTTATTTPETVTNCLGEPLPIAQTWPDGSYNCPFCGAVVTPSHRDRPCPNPACQASPWAKPADVLRRREQYAEAERERERRKAASERMIAAHHEWQEQQAAAVAQARDAGYCTLCFVRSGNRKRVRHRTPDYHEHRPR